MLEHFTGILVLGWREVLINYKGTRCFLGFWTPTALRPWKDPSKVGTKAKVHCCTLQNTEQQAVVFENRSSVSFGSSFCPALGDELLGFAWFGASGAYTALYLELCFCSALV